MQEPRTEARLDFVILGAQRSGTTFLHHRLAEHPQVFMPVREVPYFEDPDFHTAPPSDFAGLFTGAAADQICGIKRPSYLALPYVADRLRSAAPGLRLLAVLRNPVDRAVSAYVHYVRTGFVPPLSVNAGLTRLISGAWERRYPRSREILEFGYYGRHLSAYLSRFPREQLLVLSYEGLTAAPERAMRRTYAFLGVDESYVPSQLEERVNDAQYPWPHLALLWFRSRFAFTYNAERTRMCRKESQSRLDRAATRSLDRLIDILPDDVSRRPILSPSVREALVELYRPDLVALSQLGLVDLSWPEFPTAFARAGA